MRYWALKPDGKDAEGPYEMAALRTRPGFGPESIVAPENAQAADAWRPAKTYDDLRASFSKPPPLPMAKLPPPVKGEATPKVPSTLMKCPGCGKDVSPEAPNCPACGIPIASRTSPKRIGIALAIVFGLPLLFILFGSSPNDPVAPAAHVQEGLAKPAMAAKIHRLEAERKGKEERAEQLAKRLRGTPIDYPTFFAKAKAGLPLGKRFTFRAKVTHGFALMDQSGETTGHFLTTGHSSFNNRIDEDNRPKVDQFLKGPDDQIFNVTAGMLANEDGFNEVVVFRLE